MERSLFDSIPREIGQLLVSFSDSIQEINDIVISFKKVVLKNENELPPLQQIQTELSLTYAMNALFFVYLRAHGVDVKNHPISKELDSLKTCLKRCQGLFSKQCNDVTHSRLGVEASKRFVKRALWHSAQPSAKKRKLDS